MTRDRNKKDGSILKAQAADWLDCVTTSVSVPLNQPSHTHTPLFFPFICHSSQFSHSFLCPPLCLPCLHRLFIVASCQYTANPSVFHSMTPSDTQKHKPEHAHKGCYTPVGYAGYLCSSYLTQVYCCITAAMFIANASTLYQFYYPFIFLYKYCFTVLLAYTEAPQTLLLLWHFFCVTYSFPATFRLPLNPDKISCNALIGLWQHHSLYNIYKSGHKFCYSLKSRTEMGVNMNIKH